MSIQMSFRARLVLLSMLPITVVLIAAALLSYQAARGAIVVGSQQYTSQLATTTADRIEGQLQRYAQAPRMLSALTQTTIATPTAALGELHRAIPNMLAVDPSLFDLYVFFEPQVIPSRDYAAIWYLRNADNQIVFQPYNIPGDPGFDPARPYNYFEQTWYTQPRSTRSFFWTTPYFDTGSRRYLISGVFPVLLNDKVIGVVGTDVPLASVNALVEQTRPTAHSYVMMISNSGQIIAHTQQPNLALQSTIADIAQREASPALANLGIAMQKGNSGLIEMQDPFIDQDVWVAYQPVSATGWSLAVVVPKGDVLDSLTQVSTTLLLITLVALLVLGLLIWLVAASITRPIKLLAEGAERIASGERAAMSLGIERGDELGQLARSFESMAVQVAESHHSLARQVDERTRDLQGALNERDAQTRELSAALVEVQRKEALIEGLSMPIVPLLHDALVLPIIGTLDDRRAASLIDSMLNSITERRARIVVLDVTGLPLIDTVVAKALLNAASAARLLGTEMLLVGIRPDVAEALVSLGVSLTELRTLPDLQAAVLYSLKLTNHLRQR